MKGSYKKLDQEIKLNTQYPIWLHATMEPQNATVWVKNKEVDVWLPTQSPGAVKPIVSQITGIPREKVKVKCSSLGGGFGRRAELDALRNATEVSFQIKKPVKIDLLSRRRHEIWLLQALCLFKIKSIP